MLKWNVSSDWKSYRIKIGLSICICIYAERAKVYICVSVCVYGVGRHCENVFYYAQMLSLIQWAIVTHTGEGFFVNKQDFLVVFLLFCFWDSCMLVDNYKKLQVFFAIIWSVRKTYYWGSYKFNTLHSFYPTTLVAFMEWFVSAWLYKSIIWLRIKT